MHSRSTVVAALALRQTGLGARRIAKQLDLPLATVRDSLAGRLPEHSRQAGAEAKQACDLCGHPQHAFADLPAAYVYLLGLYLADGCISEHARGVFRLRIFLELRYPSIIEDCAAAIAELVPKNKVHRLGRRSNFVERAEPSNVEVSAVSKTWPCLFPQHGPGRKHERAIASLAGSWIWFIAGRTTSCEA